ncbi:MAG: hypothetical protein ACI4QV_05530 [Acutalibacteraceae bacterium]
MYSESYVKDIHNYILEDLKSECMYYGVDYEKISASVDFDKIDSLSYQYFSDLVDYFNGNSKLQYVDYPYEDFYPAVHEYYVSLGDINEEEDIEIAKKLAAVVDSNLNSFVNMSVTAKLFESRAASLIRILGSNFWTQLLICLIILAAFIAVEHGSVGKTLFKGFSLLFLGISFPFMTVWALKIFDMPSKIVLLDSPLKSLVDGVIYSSVNIMFKALLIIFAVSAAGMFVWAYMYAREQNRNHRRRRHHRHHEKNGLVFKPEDIIAADKIRETQGPENNPGKKSDDDSEVQNGGEA